MNNFGFNNLNNLNNDNPLMQYLKQYVPQQSQPMDSPQPVTQEVPRGNGFLYEINCQADIDYIEIDKSGRTQIFICQNEKRIYTRRYNHSKQKPDYKEYIEEKETKLSQESGANEGMSQIAEALVAIVNKLEAMDNAIHEIKNIQPINKPAASVEPETKTTRDASGRFVKKGGK